MKPTKQTITASKTTADRAQLESIELASLDAVTGGCGACGQSCAAGAAPQDEASSADKLNMFTRR